MMRLNPGSARVLKYSLVVLLLPVILITLALFFDYFEWVGIKDYLSRDFAIESEDLVFFGIALLVFSSPFVVRRWVRSLNLFLSMRSSRPEALLISRDQDRKEGKGTSPALHNAPNAIFALLLLSFAVAAFAPDWAKSGVYHTMASALNPFAEEFVTPAERSINVVPSPDRQGDSLEKTKLPVIELTIPELSMQTLLKAIPEIDPNINKVTNFSRFAGVDGPQWPWVPAALTYGRRTYDVEVRFRGWNMDHFMVQKKSWRVKFPKDNLFYGLREINIINQRDHTAVIDVLRSELLRDSGLLVPTQFMVHLRINGRFAGIQTYLEQPGERFFIKHNRAVGDFYGEKKPIDSKKGFLNPDSWQKYSAWKDRHSFENLMELYRAIFSKGRPGYKEKIEEILDIDQYLTFCAHAAIMARLNPSGHNIRWIFDPVSGKFQIVPWYQGPTTYRSGNDFRLIKRLGWKVYPLGLAINDDMDGLFHLEDFRERYYSRTWELLTSSHERSRILAKIDELYELVKEDVYADSRIHYSPYVQMYISNEQWEESISRLKELVVLRDQYLKSEFNRCDLTVSAKPSGPGEFVAESLLGALTLLGRIELTSSEHIAPYVETLRIGIRGLQLESIEDLIVLDSKSGQQFKAISESNGNGEEMLVSFKIARSFPSRVSGIPYQVPLENGIFVSPYPMETGKLYTPQKTIHTLSLALRGKRVLPSTVAWEVLSVAARNSVTGDPLPSGVSPEQAHSGSRVESGMTRTMELVSHPRTPEGTLSERKPDGIGKLQPGIAQFQKTVVWSRGKRVLEEDYVVEKGTKLIVEAGAVIAIREGRSLLVKGLIEAKGTPQEPILFTSENPGEYWGVIAVATQRQGMNVFQNCIFEYGSNATLGRVDYTGVVSLYFSEGTVEECIFRDNRADDAINSKYASPTISNCRFVRNLDAVDIDFGGGIVKNCTFRDSRDDAIDLSSSWAIIRDNRIYGGGDKGISIGEKSFPKVYNNLILDCNIGIAIKDLSEPVMINNTVTRNKWGLALYRKKFEFGPSKGELINSIVFGNRTDVIIEKGSHIWASNSHIGQRVAGPDNSSDPPLFLDPGRRDFRLSDDSPCLGKGNGYLVSYYGLKGSQRLWNVGCEYDD